MAAAGDLHPIGELVVESIAVIEERAGLNQKFAGVLARPSVEPADRRAAGELANALDGEPDMLAFHRLVHVVVVDPAPAMADDLVTFSEKRLNRLAALLHGAYYTKDTDLDLELPEDAEQPPYADARAVLEHRLDDWAADAVIGRETDVVEHV